LKAEKIEKMENKKFTADQVKFNKKRKTVIENRKENKVPKNLKGYQWIFDIKDKEKEYHGETIHNAVIWCENMEFNLRKLDPLRKLKLLFEKWVIIQSQEEPETRKKIQMEAISIAYDLKEFDIMNRIAKLSDSRSCGEEKVFYQLTELFSRNVFSRSDFENFKNDWSILN
jgi:hypothetical protein